jgi:hypothetical protein
MRPEKETGYHYSGITGFFLGEHQFFHHFPSVSSFSGSSGNLPPVQVCGGGPERFKAFLFFVF